MDIDQIVHQLVVLGDRSPVQIAADLSVSPDSVERWKAGTARPRPEAERKLRQLAETMHLSRIGEPGSVMRSVDVALRQLRERLHSHGRLSSRNEALDEVAILLFAHAMGTQRDGEGISQGSIRGQRGAGPAEKLRNYVHEVVQRCLPDSLVHELKVTDFQLRLTPKEDELATRVIEIFQKLSLDSASNPLRVDFINEAFGRFLADSFVDEKELGQYLTPPEVVDFMVRLAAAHLTAQERESLLSGDPAQGFGFVLDPSCGVGSFLAEFIRVVHQELILPNRPEISGSWVGRAAADFVVGIDKSERMIRLALANLALFGAPAARLHLSNALATRGDDGAVAQSFVGRVGLILTNPPFGATFGREELVGYELAGSWATRACPTIDSELLFLERYATWLRPGGQLMAIVPDSVLTNKGIFADLRRGLADSVSIVDVISLPPVAFAAAGTTTKTSVLHLRKRSSRKGAAGDSTKFAICRDLGYTVSARGSQRTKFLEGTNELPSLLEQLISEPIGPAIRLVPGVAALDRWDATYHASLSADVTSRLVGMGLRVGEVASIIADRVDPRRFSQSNFRYIEISDVDGETYSVTCKTVDVREAPSRARQRVRAGDVLVSTVRPERRTVGVVPTWLDGSVATTGFVVLRPKSMDGCLLAALLRTPFVTEQLMRNNVGIAYPAIEAGCLPGVSLPLNRSDIDALDVLAERLVDAREAGRRAQQVFDVALESAAAEWFSQIPR